MNLDLQNQSLEPNDPMKKGTNDVVKDSEWNFPELTR